MAKITKETLQEKVYNFEITRIKDIHYSVKVNGVMVFVCQSRKEAREFVKDICKEKNIKYSIIEQINF